MGCNFYLSINLSLLLPSIIQQGYSLRNAFTGFANAAFTACVHTVMSAIHMAINPGIKNIRHLISIL